MNLYTAYEEVASFIVDASISHTNGGSFYNSTFDKKTNNTEPFLRLYIDIELSEEGIDLVSAANISVNSTANEILFSLKDIPPRFDPYLVTIVGASADGNQSYFAETQLYRLPSRSDDGSVVKVDNLYQGLLVQDYTINSTAWTPIFPYSFYVSWDGWLANSIDNVYAFKNSGYNMIHIVPNGGLPNKAFDFEQLDKFLDRCDEIGLWVMYDMRWTFKNLSSVEEQVNLLKNHKSMLLWYTGDEPDGWGDPLNSTKVSYDLIKSLDPYHPVSLCLNCFNFYYKEYASGADIILSDPYVIGMNASFSGPYGTVCNRTYGDCGCDDCEGNFEDIAVRLDSFAQYDKWIGGPPKVQWGVPQAFGNETFWSRYPTPEEEVVMNMLSVNHNAKGIVMWDYPTQPGLMEITGKLGKVLSSSRVTSFLLGSETISLKVEGVRRVDAAGWRLEDRILISIVYMQYTDAEREVVISLPDAATGINSILWGPSGGWTISDGKLTKKDLESLGVSLIVVNLS